MGICAQSLTFISCYSVARVVGSKRYYEHSYKGDDWQVAFYVVSYILSSFIVLPYCMTWAPWANGICAMNVNDIKRLRTCITLRPNGLSRKAAFNALGRYPRGLISELGLTEFVENMAAEVRAQAKERGHRGHREMHVYTEHHEHEGVLSKAKV